MVAKTLGSDGFSLSANPESRCSDRPEDKESILRRALAVLLVLAVVATGGYFGWRHWRISGTSADITPLVPADVESLAFISRLDGAIDQIVRFSRGIQEGSRLRDLFKAETGADLGTPDGLRQVGLDPEGAVAAYRRGGLYLVLASVEESEILEAALSAKLKNLGYKEVVATEPDTAGLRVWTAVDANGATTAGFTVHGGVVAIAMGDGRIDIIAAIREAVAGPKEAFFGSARHQAIEAQLPGDGILLYEAADRLLMDATGAPKAAIMDAIVLPPAVSGTVKPWIDRWIRSVRHVAARVAVEPCSTGISLLLDTDGGALLPDAWLQKKIGAPDFGRLLPRDTILMLRTALDVRAIAEPIIGLATVGASLNKLLGDGQDPVASALGQYVHKELADRHVVTDLVDHLTGHAMVAVLGVDKKAPLTELGDLTDVRRWLSQVHVVVGLGLSNGQKFIDTWWAERALLVLLGIDFERIEHPEWLALKLERNCKPPPPPPPNTKPKPPPLCERYGVLATPSALLLTSGQGTLERVLAAASGKATNLRSLTREPLALGVLDHGPELVGAYFSFDGLLKAVSNRNLPGGATRYLAQFFELALGIELRGGDVSARVLLTR